MKIRASGDWGFAALFLVVGLAVCWHQKPLDIPLTVDNQIYFFISERVASGVPPHVSLFDAKNALGSLMTGAAMKVGRAFGIDDLHSARALSIAVTAACFPLLWLLARRLTGSRLAAHFAVLALLPFRGFLVLGVMGARPKVFLVFFVILALLAATHRRVVALGVMAAACFLVWQPALIILGAAALVTLLDGERRWRDLRALMGAALATVALYEAYFLWHGALGEQLFQSLVFPASYPKAPHPFLFTLNHLLDWGLKPARDFTVAAFIERQLWLKVLSRPRAIVMIVAALPVLSLWTALLVRPRRTLAAVGRLPGAACFLVSGHAAFAFMFIDYQGYPDRFVLLPFAAVLSGATVAWPLGWFERRWQSIGFQLTASVLAVAAAVYIVSNTIQTRYNYHLADQRRVAAAVGEVIDAGYTVYAIGCPHLLAMNRKGNFSEYGFFPWRVRQHFMTRIHEHGQWRPQKEGKLPDVVLGSRAGFAHNTIWLSRHYRRSDRAAFVRQSVRIWLRRGLPWDLVPGRPLRGSAPVQQVPAPPNDRG